MLPAILKVEIPLFALAGERIYYEISDKGIYLENKEGVKIIAKAGTEILKLWRVK